MIGLEVRLFVNRQIGKILYHLGFTPTHSTSIADTHTVGYGELDDSGFWQFPVPSGYWKRN